MEQVQQDNIYESENADRIVSDLFSGRMSIEQALQKLRTKLLDLSTRNRLISYRYPKGRSLQFVDKPNLNLVFSRLIESKALSIKFIPDPPPDSYSTKKTDVKAHAQSLGIDVEQDFPLESCCSSTHKHTPRLQALYYPADLYKVSKKIASDARTVIEETGTNMLYLIFGFLEFYDSDDSEKPIFAPLLAVPVTLDRGAIDPDTRTYQYAINYSGEDVHENQTLREKLSQDFNLQLPDFNDEDEPGTYFSSISQAVKNKKRWKVRYQLTLGFLSFGKLAIWDDLNPKKWPGLLSHPLLNEIFSGGSGNEVSLSPEDYEIDSHPQGDLPLIYDADSSQHSAIIDVLSGKNMVINGPPGTGKSQTITNIIAAGLKAGKKILFVSEKLAALEVVRHRLNHAHLGHFCLELHSHKTQKKKLLSDLQDRLDAQFFLPQHFQNKITTLNRHKKDLNRYVEIISSQIGNELGMTVYDVFWKTEKYRQSIGDLVNKIQSLNIPKADSWTYDHIEDIRAKLEGLGQLFSTLKNYDSNHPWWGFIPKPLAPGDDFAIGRIINEAQAIADGLYVLVIEFQDQASFLEEPSIDDLTSFNRIIQELPVPPGNLQSELLPRVFTSTDPLGKRNRVILNGVIQKVESARELRNASEKLLCPDCQLEYDTAEPVVETCTKTLAKAAFSTPLDVLAESVSSAEIALIRFKQVNSELSCNYLPIYVSSLENLDSRLQATLPLSLVEQPGKYIKEGAKLLSQEVSRLEQSLERVSSIAKRRALKFDDSPSAIANLGQGDGIDEILPGVNVDSTVLEKAKQAAEFYLSDLSIGELDKRQHELHSLHDRITRLLHEIEGYASKLGLPFDSTQKSIEFLATVSKISASAPSDLLDYRHASLAHPLTLELLPKAEGAFSSENSQRQSLANEFYLDVLPDLGNLKAAILTFRRGDSLFNIFNGDWRAAKKLFNSVSKTKIKCKATEYEAKITSLVCWIEHRTLFISNDEFQKTFGTLFKGLDTDFSKIRRLHNWYIESQAELLKHPGFIEQVDLTSLNSQTINQLGALSARLEAISAEFDICLQESRQLLEDVATQMDSVLRQFGWNGYNQKILLIADGFRDSSSYLQHFVKHDVSPKRSVDVLNAKLELLSASADFDALNYGIHAIQDKLEPLLPSISQIPCINWREYLLQLARLAHASESLAETLSEYADSNCNTSKTRTFIVAKLELDDSLSKFAEYPDRTTTASWEEYHSIAGHRIAAAADLVNLLKPVGATGKTAKEVVTGLNSKKKSVVLIHKIRSDESIMSMLQDLFYGMDTDLESLSATLSWGEVVSKKRTIQGTPLFSFILCHNAVENFNWSKVQLQNITGNHRNLLNKLSELRDFGELEINNWNSLGDGYVHLLLKRIEFAVANLEAVLPWSKYYTQRTICRDIGLKSFVTHIENKELPFESIGNVFEYVVYRSIGRKIYIQFPELDKFSGVNHEKLRSDFVALDKDIIRHTGRSFAYEIDRTKKVPDGVTSYKVSELTEMHLLRKELGKKTKHISIRQLIRRAGKAVQALKPCFMMGPLSVAQYIQQGTINFDMIVMDEASQLRPEESLGAIARGSQLIVVGDPKQLPPTNFFDRLVDDGDEEEDSDTPAVFTGSESILDICQQLFHPVRTLKWHYRSQHESLIAFSNHHFYNGKLIVFPSPFARNSRLGLRYRYIKNGTYKDRQNMPEAQRVADAVIEHMMKFPEESLGVVTLNQTQRDLIEDLLDKKIRNIEEAQTFISNWEEEGWPFFVKNLENVQGDERDIIFISTTFGKAAGTDKVRQNFGPISRPDGWRRLNVLFTRSRRKIELFTSMLPEDIILATNTPAGTRALKEYLDFAKHGILTSTEVSGREADSDFEISVGDMLRNRGYEVVPQVGVAGFFIDLAVRNPDRPGEFLAAVECDGASYHSSNSARDRDRIRQAILESLGWKDRIWRIWSTDWFYNPRRESERLLNFLEERRAKSLTEPLDYEIEDVFEELEEAVVQPAEEAVDTFDPSLSVSVEELFVEVGDLVTYCAVDKPEERHTVMIVDSESNARRNLINENTPLAKALLDTTVGDEVEMVVHGSKPKIMRVLKIQRQEKMFQ
ncbi:MAG: superfamily I DNA/RNA [Geobacteraceae bacterium]|nr:MAG: superfamily I DNA/RNA [Geobacteraceae bacterium]